jgi:hypothetical protein
LSYVLENENDSTTNDGINPLAHDGQVLATGVVRYPGFMGQWPGCCMVRVEGLLMVLLVG